MWVNVGNAQRDSGMMADALLSYQKGLALDPTSDLLVRNLEQFESVAGGPTPQSRQRPSDNNDGYEEEMEGFSMDEL